MSDDTSNLMYWLRRLGTFKGGEQELYSKCLYWDLIYIKKDESRQCDRSAWLLTFEEECNPEHHITIRVATYKGCLDITDVWDTEAHTRNPTGMIR